jgi:transposase
MFVALLNTGYGASKKRDRRVLQEGERTGRPRRLSPKQLAELEAVLRRAPGDVGISGNVWDRKTLAAWIERQYGARLGVRQCQRLFRHLGFRLREPRPVVARAGPERQKAHKKNSSS